MSTEAGCEELDSIDSWAGRVKMRWMREKICLEGDGNPGLYGYGGIYSNGKSRDGVALSVMIDIRVRIRY
jgi:hypothetical protein